MAVGWLSLSSMVEVSTTGWTAVTSGVVDTDGAGAVIGAAKLTVFAVGLTVVGSGLTVAGAGLGEVLARLVVASCFGLAMTSGAAWYWVMAVNAEVTPSISFSLLLA